MSNKILDKNIKNMKLLKGIGQDSYYDTFISFESINNIFYLVYSNKEDSIVIYNIIYSQKISEIKSGKDIRIEKLRHHLDKKNKRDLIIALYSLIYPCIYIWNILNCECLINIRERDVYVHLNDICILNDNNKDSIFLCFYESSLKEYDFKGNLIKAYKEYSKENNHNMNIYYDDKTKNNFIITYNYGYIKSYNYNINKYYKFKDIDDKEEAHYESSIYESNGKKILIDGSHLAIIRIWDFHSTILIKKIKIEGIDSFSCMCIWNEKYIFIGKSDGIIRIVDITTGKILKKLKGHKRRVVNLRKIGIPQYGDYIISQEKTIYNMEGPHELKVWGIQLPSNKIKLRNYK